MPSREKDGDLVRNVQEAGGRCEKQLSSFSPSDPLGTD